MVKVDMAADAEGVLYYFNLTRNMFPLDRLRLLCEFIDSKGLVSEFARFVQAYESRQNLQREEMGRQTQKKTVGP